MYFKKLILISLFSFGVLSHPFQSCSSTDKLRISNLDFSTEDIEPGTSLKVTIKGNPEIDISPNAKAKVEVRVMGVSIYSENVNLCEYFSGISCPLKSGQDFSATMKYDIPLKMPHLDVELRTTVTDNEIEIGCFKTEIEVKNAKQTVLEKDLKFLFHRFVKQYGIKLDDYARRFLIFVNNWVDIMEHNQFGLESYKKGMNEFGHLTSEEFSNHYFGYNPSNVKKSTHTFKFRGTKNDLPTSVDWRKKGAVTSVKNQKNCGSCWSFSVTGSVEGAYFLKTGKLVSFSEQQLVSCDKGSLGCNGGLMDQAFEWIESNKGLCSEEDYPYVSQNGIPPGDSCKICTPVPGSEVKHFVDVPVDSEIDLMAAVTQQPVSVAIEADQTAFQFYKSGILTGRCGKKLDHGVLTVGFGTENGVDFWIVKNSWGDTWGEDGYIRLQRGKVIGPFDHSGECGILASASYPELV